VDLVVYRPAEGAGRVQKPAPTAGQSTEPHDKAPTSSGYVTYVLADFMEISDVVVAFSRVRLLADEFCSGFVRLR
jgi:hypothetical protein